MSKVKVKVIDILDDKYAIVKKSDGICKLLETNEDSNLKINQAYLLIKSTEDKDVIIQGNLKPIKIADIVIKDIQKDKKEVIRKLYNSKIELTSSKDVSIDCIKSFASENNNKDINSTDLKITGKVIRVNEKDGLYGKFYILTVKDIENQKIIIMVYNKKCDVNIGEVVNISKLKYTNRQKENMHKNEIFVQTTYNSEILKVQDMSAKLFENISLGDVTKEAKFAGITQSQIYFSCEHCSTKCSVEEPQNPINCVKCKKQTNTKKDHYVEIVLEDNEDVIYLVVFKKDWEIKEISEFNPKGSDNLEEFIINICDGKDIVFDVNHDKKIIDGSKCIAVNVKIK